MITSNGREWSIIDGLASQSEESWHNIFGSDKKYLDWSSVYQPI